MLVCATRAWLDLTLEARAAFLATIIAPLLKKHPQVSLRFFDSEAYSARVSDIMMWETSDLTAYEDLIDTLRDSLFWGLYFEVLDILPAVENGYARRVNALE